MNKLRFPGSLFLALAWALAPAAAQPDELVTQNLKLALSTDEEVFDLGGPCADGEGSNLPDFYTKLREARERGDHRQGIELRKQNLRAMCSNHNRWYDLAEAYLGADRTGLAMQVLHAVHRRGAEIKPSSFRHRQSLALLIGTPEFGRSELGRELQELRRAAALRKGAYRTRLEAVDTSARPPERYVAEGACPFECCTYRDWDVLETTPLYETPFGTVVVGSAVKGDHVRGVTGEVHLRPAPVAVVHDRSPFERGEILFVLDYVGEGIYRYWRRGEIATGELWIDDVCLRPSRDCWAEYIQAPDTRREPQWWFLIETNDGVSGWANRPQHFGNKDACG